MIAFYHAASQLPGVVPQALMRHSRPGGRGHYGNCLRSGRLVSSKTPSGARFALTDGGWREN